MTYEKDHASPTGQPTRNSRTQPPPIAKDCNMRLQIRPGKSNYRAIWQVDGKRYNRSTGVPHAHADPAEFTKYKEKAMVRGSIMERETRAATVNVGMTIRDYLEACIHRHRGRRGETWRLFLEALGERGGDLLVELSREHQRRYMLMRGEELGYTTLAEELNCIWEVCEHAVDGGVLQFNPIDLTDIGSWYLRDGLSTIQIKGLLLAAQNIEWRTAIYLGYYAGATLAQAIRMEWTALNADPQNRFWLSLPETKRTKGRRVRVHPGLQAHLISLRRTNTFVCPALSTLETQTAENRFSELIAAAKLPDTMTFGSLKRTFAAVLGVPIRKADSAPPDAALKLPDINIPPLACQVNFPSLAGILSM